MFHNDTLINMRERLEHKYQPEVYISCLTRNQWDPNLPRTWVQPSMYIYLNGTLVKVADGVTNNGLPYDYWTECYNTILNQTNITPIYLIDDVIVFNWSIAGY